MVHPVPDLIAAVQTQPPPLFKQVLHLPGRLRKHHRGHELILSLAGG